MHAQSLSERSQISILTCEPGRDLYAKYGHTALRVMDPENGLDIVFNYGLFSFDTDHFYYKFVRGETWYQLGVEDMNGFIIEYRRENRHVFEQVLALNTEQKDQIWQALLENYRPENRSYLYNFVFDNCATRPYRLIFDAIQDSIRSDYQGYEGQTYRHFISRYTGPHSWTDFGINLLFGPKADQPMHSDERLFLPEEVMFYLSQARRSNGEPLVMRQHIHPFTIEKTPWYETWYVGITLLALLLIGISILDRKRNKLSLWIDILLGIVYLIILLIVGFLTFFSLHPLVGFGWRLLIIPLIHLCARLIYIIR